MTIKDQVYSAVSNLPGNKVFTYDDIQAGEITSAQVKRAMRDLEKEHDQIRKVKNGFIVKGRKVT